ncbi:MAG: TIGR02530 family flagellar biosynthesis protein [Syntrophomonadaceae bacterium]|jgi:flagellar operon protein
MTDKVFWPQPIQPVTPANTHKTSKSRQVSNNAFNQVLEGKLNHNLKFSNHAQQRLKSRNINLSATDLDKLTSAVDKAREKGARDSLILMNDLALVVSVKNNTVITAVDGQSLKENVFTNIDSAVIV